MTRPAQHWLTAAVIGGFGRKTTGRLRDALVAVRRRRGGNVTIARAETVGYERGLYTLAAPPAGLDPNRIDQIFGSIEPGLPAAIARLEARNATSADEQLLLDYIAALASRHPDHFKKVSDDFQAQMGAHPLVGDPLQIGRLQALLNSLPQVRTWHWRVLESPDDAPRFILNDLGFSYVGQEQRPGRAIFVPLSPRGGALGFIGQHQGFASRHVLTPMSVAWLNALTWSEAPREAYAHPDDKDTLAGLGDPIGMRYNRCGPYRGTNRNLLDE